MIPKIFAQTPQTISGEEPASFQDLETIFSNILAFALPLLAIVLFIMLIIGGYKYITAGDNPKAAESARSTLTYAIGGIILAAIAFLILRIIAALTGQNNILYFNIYQPN